LSQRCFQLFGGSRRQTASQCFPEKHKGWFCLLCFVCLDWFPLSSFSSLLCVGCGLLVPICVFLSFPFLFFFFLFQSSLRELDLRQNYNKLSDKIKEQLESLFFERKSKHKQSQRKAYQNVRSLSVFFFCSCLLHVLCFFSHPFFSLSSVPLLAFL
jgi:hypothetical protein